MKAAIVIILALAIHDGGLALLDDRERRVPAKRRLVRSAEEEAPLKAAGRNKSSSLLMRGANDCTGSLDKCPVCISLEVGLHGFGALDGKTQIHFFSSDYCRCGENVCNANDHNYCKMSINKCSFLKQCPIQDGSSPIPWHCTCGSRNNTCYFEAETRYYCNENSCGKFANGTNGTEAAPATDVSSNTSAANATSLVELGSQSGRHAAVRH
eukprot:TRINITY_DN121604_c0_g1_i1.p1 TRINITY_DN121604_c0_g1~~TRINITY_DN121604_c0_g1_i1.p1  ORF type:complete len:211 (-),score=44.51 TRINITY_DN121604_c0_g1_i1:70-702(-)